MKKFLIVLLSLFIGNITFAAVPVDFIYLNGSNTNTKEAYEVFVKKIIKFHPYLKSGLEKDPFTYEHILKNGEYEIEATPSDFFWGDRSREALLTMQAKANMLKGVSPIFAFGVRNLMAGMLHDAIWVKNTTNMAPILEDLDKQVKKDTQEGKKVVLLGYSAGTFITLEYIITRSPYINIADWFKDKDIAPELKTLIKNNPRKNTCPNAFITSNLVHATPFVKVIPNTNKEEFKKAYMDIDKYTDEYCAPKDTIIGIINYASPIPLFYSDLNDPRTDVNQFLAMMYKALIGKDFFFLTVNFSDDPLGFPNGVNYTNEELENMLNVKFEDTKGFFYDYSNTISMKTVIGAHTSYLPSKKRFAKAIVKGYTEAYNFHYGAEATQKAKQKDCNKDK